MVKALGRDAMPNDKLLFLPLTQKGLAGGR